MSRPLACADRSGFLFAHACDRPAAGACSLCSKPICTEHTRMGSQGPTCVTCLRGEGDVDTDADDDDGDDAAEGRGKDDPYFYGGPERVVRLTHRYFFPLELEALLHYNGFEIEAHEGDFDGAPLETESEEQVIRCRVRRA